MKTTDLIVLGVVVIILAIIVAFTVVNLPAEKVVQIVENKTVEYINSTTTVMVYVTPTPEPMRTIVPRPTPTPQPRILLIPFNSKSMFDVNFDKSTSNIDKEERGLIFGRDREWRNSNQGEIVYNAMAHYQETENKEATSIEGTFEKFVFSENGKFYVAENISADMEMNILNQKKIRVFVGTFTNEEGEDQIFANYYLGNLSSNVVVATGTGPSLKAKTVNIPGSDSGGSSGGGSSGGSSGGGSSGGGSSNGGGYSA